MKKLYYFFICLFFLCTLAEPVLALNNLRDWKTYETDNFIIFYPAGYEYQAQETAYYLETQLPRVQELTGNDRQMKTLIVIQDVGIESNGYANSFSNKIGIFTNLPATDSSLSSYQNWFRLVSGHELTHIRQLTNYSGKGAVLPVIFGDFMSSNQYVPGWIVEGITVYSESQFSSYEGRLNDGYYDALIASKASAGKFPNILEASYQHTHYPLGQWYVYGGAFMRYLAENYGEEKLTNFFDVQGTHPIGLVGSITPYLGVDLAARKVFQKSFTELFTEWQTAEELEHQDWKISGEPVIESTRDYIHNLVSYQGKLYYAELSVLAPHPGFYSGAFGLVEYDPAVDSKKVLKTFSTSSPVLFQIANDQIYYALFETKEGYANVDQAGYGSTASLFAYNLETGESAEIFTDELKAFFVQENGDIIYAKDRKDKYGAEIWKYSTENKFLLGSVDQVVAEMVSYGGKALIVSKPDGGSWNINCLDLSSLAVTPVINTPWSESAIAVEGDMLYFTANYEGIYAVYEYDMVTKDLARLTEGGYAYNGVSVRNDFFFKTITPNGDAIYQTDFQPVPWTLPESEEIMLANMQEFIETLEAKPGFKKNLSYLLKPTIRLFPSLLEGQDGLGLNSYAISYSPYVSLDFSFTTRIVMPLVLNIDNMAVSRGGERETIVSAYYPLHKSNQNPVSSIDLTGYTNFKDDLVLGAKVQINSAAEFITGDVRTNIGNGGWNINLGYHYFMENGALILKGSYVNKFNHLVDLRYQTVDVSETEKVRTFSADFVHKLAEVRKGYWPLNLFLVDIYGGIFTDFIDTGSGKTSYGIELLGEVGFGYGVTIVPRVGLAITEAGMKPYIGVKTQF